VAYRGRMEMDSVIYPAAMGRNILNGKIEISALLF